MFSIKILQEKGCLFSKTMQEKGYGFGDHGGTPAYKNQGSAPPPTGDDSLDLPTYKVHVHTWADIICYNVCCTSHATCDGGCPTSTTNIYNCLVAEHWSIVQNIPKIYMSTLTTNWAANTCIRVFSWNYSF